MFEEGKQGKHCARYIKSKLYMNVGFIAGQSEIVSTVAEYNIFN